VVNLSANQAYGTSAAEQTNRDIEKVAFHEAIAHTLR
jgi:hypothetical protein